MKTRPPKPLVVFSPLNVIDHFHRLEATFLKSGIRSGVKYDAFRKAQEASFVAEALAGRRSADGEDYWLRIVDDKDQSPDIKTYSWQKSGKVPDHMWEHYVEVTEYEHHSSEPLVEFLQKRKLHKYRDDSQLIILCRVSRPTSLPPLTDIKRDLVQKKAVNPILICGIISTPEEPKIMFRLIQIEPDANAVPESHDFDLKAELLNMKYAGVLVLNDPTSENKHYPFEVLGFTPNENGSYSF